MKLAYEDKVQIYELRRQEEEYLKWGVNASILHTKEKLARKQITLVTKVGNTNISININF